MFDPIVAAYYAKKHRKSLGKLAIPDLDTAEHVWGHRDSSFAFRNVLVGPPEHRGELWQSWLATKQFETAEDPKFYILQQEQVIDGKKLDRWALYGSVRVDDPRLYIHEDVYPEGVERARQGAESCESDMAPVFIGCEESVAQRFHQALPSYCKERTPLLTFHESMFAKHRVWVLEEQKLEVELKNLLSDAPLFLLDGHHRLAAARENYRLGLGDGKILVCLSTLSPLDTLILPIHRGVISEHWMLPDTLITDLVRAGCSVDHLEDPNPAAIQAVLLKLHEKEPACLMLHAYSDKPCLVRLPSLKKLAPELNQLAVARLDFGVLSNTVQTIPVVSIDSALEQLAMDQTQAAFFLPPASPVQVRAVAKAGLIMPKKSTRFVPKPALGLLCRPWHL